MKITNIIGSPRASGNSATIARMLLECWQTSTPQVKTYELNGLTYRGCQGCMACKTTSDKCVVTDGLSLVLEEIRTSDVVVIASPIYCGDVSAQTKGLIDRCYSYYQPDYLTNPHPGRLAPGKKLVFVVSQGNPDPKAYEDVITKYTRTFRRIGFTDIYPLRVLGVGPKSDGRADETLTQLINATAAKVVADAGI